MNPGLEDSGPRAVASRFLRPQNETPRVGRGCCPGPWLPPSNCTGPSPRGRRPGAAGKSITGEAETAPKGCLAQGSLWGAVVG